MAVSRVSGLNTAGTDGLDCANRVDSVFSTIGLYDHSGS